MAGLSYLEYNDFLRYGEDRLQLLIDEDPQVLVTVGEYTVDFVSSFLRKRYDVATLFALRGANRHKVLVAKCVDIAIAELEQRDLPSRQSDARKAAAESAIKWLQLVANYKIDPDFPPLDIPNTDAGSMAWGSRPELDYDF